jgi:glycerophosphoryl diester phosphodiesterase
MAAPGSMRERALVPGRAGPALIAHGAGNSVQRIREAVEAGTDFVEVDLWVHGGRFEARHERAAYPLPVWFEKWYLRRRPRTPFGLADLLQEAEGHTRVFLDLKNGDHEAAALVRRAFDEGGPGVALAASGQQWGILRALAGAAPEVDLFYSIDATAKLDLFLSVIDRDVAPRGVSCRHTLLTEPLVQRLHERGLAVVAWTVDTAERARELASWGVEGITTHQVAALRTALIGAT